LNSLFLDEVKFNHQWKSPELKSSGWPYALAVKSQIKKVQIELAESTRIFTVDDLVALKVIPAKEIQLKGRVTKLSGILLPTKDAQFVIDKAVFCEINIPYSLRNEFLFLSVIGEELCSISKHPSAKGEARPRGTPIYKNGQEVTVFGICTRRTDGRLFFKITKGSFPWGAF